MLYSDDEEDDVDREAARLLATHRSIWGQINYYTERVFTRLARIVGAVVALILLYNYSGRYSALAHTPFAQLTPADLFWLLLGAFAALYVLVIAWHVAFGHGPRAPSAYDFQQQALGNVELRQAHQQRVAKAYARARWWGVLNDESAPLLQRFALAILFLAALFAIGLLAVTVFAYLANLFSK
jgi:hypothetical protein